MGNERAAQDESRTPWYRRRKRRSWEMDPADIAGIYGRAAREGLAARNPLIFIPGIMGSKLVDPEDSRSVWGEFLGPFARPDKSGDAAVVALPMSPGVPLDRLRGTVRADGSLGLIRARAFGMPLALRAYGDVLSAMGVGSYRGTYARSSRDEPIWSEEAKAASFEFAYDWRRSLDETAARLAEFMRLAARFVQAQQGTTDPIRFDVIAHSMGGLVLRYLLRYGGQLLAHDGSLPRLDWSGAAMVDRAVIVGTPNAGSLVVLDRLVAGVPKNPVHPTYDPIVCGTMPALYQLLPRTRHRPFEPAAGGGPEPDLLDAAFWRHMGWGLADPNRSESLARVLEGVASPAERRDIALDHQEKCLTNARALHAALDEPVTVPEHLELHLVAGDAIATSMITTGRPGEGRLHVTRKAPGDGTVLRSSALLDERVGGTWTPRLQSPINWDSITFIRSNHMGLTRDPIFLDNALFHLLESPRTGLRSRGRAVAAGSAKESGRTPGGTPPQDARGA